jgi:hypothetical protein
MPVELLEMMLVGVGCDYFYIVAMVCRQWHAIVVDYLRRKKLMYKPLIPFHTPNSIVYASVPLFTWARIYGKMRYNDDFMIRALYANASNDVIETILSLTRFINDTMYIAAARMGNTHAIELFGLPTSECLNTRMTQVAIKCENTNVLYAMYEKGVQKYIFGRKLHLAIVIRNLGALRFMYEIGIEETVTEVAKYAATYGNVEFLNLLDEMGHCFSQNDCDIAYYYNNNAYADKMHLMGCSCNCLFA